MAKPEILIVGRIVIAHDADDENALRSIPDWVAVNFIKRLCDLYQLSYPSLRFVPFSAVHSNTDHIEGIWEVHEFHIPYSKRNSRSMYSLVLRGAGDYLLMQSRYIDCSFDKYPYKVPF